jgi:hypothetical protein
MPELQRIDLQFTRLEGLRNMENLASLLEVHLTMDKQADEATREVVSGLATAARGRPGSSTKKVKLSSMLGEVKLSFQTSVKFVGLHWEPSPYSGSVCNNVVCLIWMFFLTICFLVCTAVVLIFK